MILLGDSITAWNPRKDAVNMGVPGDTVRDILWRVEDILELTGDEVYLMAGINDIIMGFSEGKILENYTKLVGTLKKNFKRLIVISVLPVDSSSRNEIIRSLNKKIEEITQEAGGEYLDIYQEFTGKDGNIDIKYTTDGVHLSSKGYDLLNTKLTLPL